MPISLRRCGDRGWMVDCTGPDRAAVVHRALERSLPEGVTDLVPAAATVLVRFDPDVLSAAAVADRIRLAVQDRPAESAHGPGRAVEIEVVYDGPDLVAVSDHLGLSPTALVQLHSRAGWRSDFIGFAPGFAYLTTADLSWRLPRRSSSRPTVPPGSVAVADGFTGIYPRASPGGWQLIGRTAAVLWDLAATPPALLAPGTTVRFVPVRP